MAFLFHYGSLQNDFYLDCSRHENRKKCKIIRKDEMPKKYIEIKNKNNLNKKLERKKFKYPFWRVQQNKRYQQTTHKNNDNNGKKFIITGCFQGYSISEIHVTIKVDS